MLPPWLPDTSFYPVRLRMRRQSGAQKCFRHLIYLYRPSFSSPNAVENCLLVFDNVENWRSIERFWPVSSHGAVLLTTQNPELAQITSCTIQLQSLFTNTAVELMFKHLHRTQDQQPTQDIDSARLISEELRGLPMAVAHVTGYIDQSQCTLTDFRIQFQEITQGSDI
jgi:hypothetical protein